MCGCAAQVWPYLKPLRKWIKRQQRGTQEGLWDMPQTATPPAQQQQGGRKQRSNQDGLWDMPPIMPNPQQQQPQKQQSGKKQPRSQQDGLWDMPQTTPSPMQQRGAANGAQMSPLPQQVQQLAQSERRSGGGGSPKHTLHAQFHEAAIAQARQQAAVSSGPQLPAGGGPVAAAPVAAGGAGTFSGHELGSGRSLAKLFGSSNSSAAAREAASSNDLLSCSPGKFTFNRQQILHALNSPAGPGVPLRHQITGRG